MSLLIKIIFRNFSKKSLSNNSQSRLISATSRTFSGDIKDNSFKIAQKESKIKVKLYPGFQQSVEEIRYDKLKNEEEKFGWPNIFLVNFTKNFTNFL